MVCIPSKVQNYQLGLAGAFNSVPVLPPYLRMNSAIWLVDKAWSNPPVFCPTQCFVQHDLRTDIRTFAYKKSDGVCGLAMTGSIQHHSIALSRAARYLMEPPGV